MGRPVILSNGHVLVGLDDHGTVHDFYYPYIGLENMTSARILNHKIGVWSDGAFSWIDDDTWKITIDFEDEALVSCITAEHETLGVRLEFQDFVDTRYPAFCRRIKVVNTKDSPSEIRLFLHQAFQISRNGRSDTAMYVPSGNYLLDYKGWSSFLIYSHCDGTPFDQFAVGNYGIEGKEGTFRDAEDGELSGGLIEHGGVDSVMRLKLELEPGASKDCNYWVIVSDSQFDAEAIHHVLLTKGLEERLEATRQAWRQWHDISRDKIDAIDDSYRKLVKKSLMIVKAHTDNHGGIIASSDSSIYNYGRDYYCYVWPRDGAYAVMPLIELGYTVEPKKFIEFCCDTVHPSGYMMHKYQPDRAVGSTWHPLEHRNHPELPIQEDETAILLYTIGRYAKTSDDYDFARSHYQHFIKPAADFITGFFDEATNLPHASYDLWEERFATHTYTAFVTRAGLFEAAAIAEKFNCYEDRDRWIKAGQRISDNLSSFFSDELGYYRKSFIKSDDGLQFDDTLDVSSAFGALLYAADTDDRAKLSKTVEAIENNLLSATAIGGSPRYVGDHYFLTKNQYPGNPWIITTLWIAQYYIHEGNKQRAQELIDWVVARAGQSGMLAEQVDPETGFAVGVDPLVWSHSTFVETILLLSRS